MFPVPVLLVPIGRPRGDIVEAARSNLAIRLSVRVTTIRGDVDIQAAYDAGRRQYDSTVLIAGMRKLRPETNVKIVGVAKVDLFIPALTFVFGEAQLDGRLAVVSTSRLYDRVYGLPPDEGLLTQRLVKECLHELGHTAGLRHCRSRRCVMGPSHTIGEIDLKPAEFCSASRRLLDR